MARSIAGNGDHARSKAGTTGVRRAARRGVSATFALEGPIMRSTVDAGTSVSLEVNSLLPINLVCGFDRRFF